MDKLNDSNRCQCDDQPDNSVHDGGFRFGYLARITFALDVLETAPDDIAGSNIRHKLEEYLDKVHDDDPEVVEFIYLDIAFSIDDTVVPGREREYPILTGRTCCIRKWRDGSEREHGHDREEGILDEFFYVFHNA